jgi:hypothetical protein
MNCRRCIADMVVVIFSCQSKHNNKMTNSTYWVISINPDLTGNIMTFGSYPDAWNYWRNKNLKHDGMLYALIENPDVAKGFCQDHNLQFTNQTTQLS